MSLRVAAWRAGAPLRAVLVLAIHLYRASLSGWLGGQCRFFPTCSHYAEQVVQEHGAVRGIGLALWRIARCNPYGQGGIDPAPKPPARSGHAYDGITRRSEARA